VLIILILLYDYINIDIIKLIEKLI